MEHAPVLVVFQSKGGGKNEEKEPVCRHALSDSHGSLLHPGVCRGNPAGKNLFYHVKGRSGRDPVR